MAPWRSLSRSKTGNVYPYINICASVLKQNTDGKYAHVNMLNSISHRGNADKNHCIHLNRLLRCNKTLNVLVALTQQRWFLTV